MSAVPSRKDHELADDFHAPQVMPSDGGSIMAIIGRAAADPNTDVDKLERLLGMYERIKGQSAKAEYFAAMSDMQDQLPTIKERGEIKIGQNPGQKYALWEDINAAIKPVLKAHGFALSFRTGLEDGKITVTGVLSHSGGHSEETTMRLPTDTSGSKNAVQAVGSSTSYGKRYVASALLNLSTGDLDDDGKAGGAGQCIGPDKLQHIRDIMDRIGNVDVEAFCKVFKIEAVPDLRPADYDRAVSMLNTKEKKIQKDAPK